MPTTKNAYGRSKFNAVCGNREYVLHNSARPKLSSPHNMDASPMNQARVSINWIRLFRRNQ